MDIQMPGMGGVEALKRIRGCKDTAHIPVVMLTSVTRAETIVECLQHGASDYILKPFTASTIEDRVKKHLIRAESEAWAQYPGHATKQ